MSWLKIALFVSIIYILYSYQQIKITLKNKGYDVDLLSGPIEDYRRFKRLIETEPNKGLKNKYQSILNGLHFALAGLAVIAVFLISGK
jgi:hypothetical protein